MKKGIFIALFFWRVAFSQQLPVAEVIQRFQMKETALAFEIAPNQHWNIVWHERKSSFSEKQGIRSFAGYIDQQFVGVLSIFEGKISGEIFWQGNGYKIATKNGQIVISERKHHGSCGTAHSHEAHQHEKLPKTSARKTKSTEKVAQSAKKLSELQLDDIPEIYSDGILRIYRLALLVDYPLFQGKSVAEIKSFWAEAETFLNELYVRDLSVKFEIVDNESLIVKNADERIFFDNQTPDYITDNATSEINKRIGEKAYDVGLVATRSNLRGETGRAGLFSVYAQHTKGDAYVSVLQSATVAHEVGHLFGAMHTFSEGGIHTLNTEPRRGQSIMSYSRTLPRDFFALPSVFEIRRGIFNRPDYYADLARTQVVGAQKTSNIVYGINTQNRPPIIHRSRLKNSYILPQDSYFQFDIKASDPDGHSLLYTAHQADILRRETYSLAMVRAAKPTLQNVVAFYPQYMVQGTAVWEEENSRPTPSLSQEYTFWLGVNDGGLLLTNPNENHAVQYDLFQTKVKFVSGTPFRITSEVKKSYQAGEKLLLKWGVDRAIFGGTKVRILLSDDLGKSWKYVLLPETENDGEAEITLPSAEIGLVQHSSQLASFGGMLKIEVIDHIAIAISENNPQVGGFELKKSELSFKNLPPQYFSAKENQIPTAPSLQAESSCASGSVSVIYKGETQSGNILTRTWEATDGCNNRANFTQFITIEKNITPLQFVGNLPKQEVHIQCVDAVTDPDQLQVTGGTSPKISFTQTKIDGDYINYTLKRTWIATDPSPDVQPIMHTQIVVVQDNQKPILSAYPPSKTIKDWIELPEIITITATDNCDTSVRVEFFETAELDSQNRVVQKRIWEAKDKAGNITRHEQRLTIDPNYVPPAEKPLQWAVSHLHEIKVSCKNAVPSPQFPATQNGKGEVKITANDVEKDNICTNKYTIERTFTAVDETNKPIYIQQIIRVEDTEKPTFVGELPENKEIERGQEIPTQRELTAQDTCGNVSVEKSFEDISENGKLVKRIYKWIAKDDCGNEVSYQQVITIKEKAHSDLPKTPEIPNNPKTPKNSNLLIYNGVSLEEGSENYFRLEGIDEKTTISVEIFNELGQKVFQSKNYGQKGEVFRGYPNVKGVFNPSKRLPTGTYFYILKYEDKSKSGYLFVK